MAERRRNLLALTSLERFAGWAATQGFEREPTKGIYEVLRLRVTGHPPVIFFTRGTVNVQHATSQAEGTALVYRWLRSRGVPEDKLKYHGGAEWAATEK